MYFGPSIYLVTFSATLFPFCQSESHIYIYKLSGFFCTNADVFVCSSTRKNVSTMLPFSIIIIIIIIIIINGHFSSAANYPCMGSLAAVYNGINTYNMAFIIISKNQSLFKI